MDDKFLTQFQKEPDRDFADGLWGQLRMIVPRSEPVVRRKRPFRLALTLTIFATLFALGFSPAVRAQIEDVLRQIGGIRFKETAVYPGAGVDEDEIIIIESELVRGENEVLIEEARTRLALDFNVPSALPERFTMAKEVLYSDVGDASARFRWRDADSIDSLFLEVRIANPDINWIVGPNSTEEVLINGRSAALITGNWDTNSQEWDNDEGTKVLRWEQNGIEYSLMIFSDILTDEELIAIAESIE